MSRTPPTDAERPNGDKALLSPKRRWRETSEVADAACRMIASTGKRIAFEDADRLRYLIQIEHEVRVAWEIAIDGLRRNFSDADIGKELGVTKQAVQQKWPR